MIGRPCSWRAFVIAALLLGACSSDGGSTTETGFPDVGSVFASELDEPLAVPAAPDDVPPVATGTDLPVDFESGALDRCMRASEILGLATAIGGPPGASPAGDATSAVQRIKAGAQDAPAEVRAALLEIAEAMATYNAALTGAGLDPTTPTTGLTPEQTAALSEAGQALSTSGALELLPTVATWVTDECAGAFTTP